MARRRHPSRRVVSCVVTQHTKGFDPRFIHDVFMSPNEFEWRPYRIALPPEMARCWVHGRDIARSNELMSFVQCLRPCELVSLGCFEQYLPHRVVRQLGFDQDMPGFVAHANSSAWDASGRLCG
uniref:Aminotransferase-like plant mobile domain-containing protein n=1 Tax=Leersia perrieri TaxID=77586 RepID=A0A0D9WWG3_9ORYZ